jgi:hypothetical protein
MNGNVLRVICVSAALLSPFFFPYPLTLLLSLVASAFIPWIALVVGVMQDALFMIPYEGRIPTATLLGAGASVVALVVRRFVKARIM